MAQDVYPLGGPIADATAGLAEPTEELYNRNAVSFFGGTFRKIRRSGNPGQYTYAWYDAISATELVTLLQSLAGDNRLPASAVRDLPSGNGAVADRSITLAKLSSEVLAHLLPTFPALGQRDDKIAKFNGNILGWEEDAGTGGGPSPSLAQFIRCGWSDDQTFVAAEFTGASPTNTVEIPTSTGLKWLGFWRSDVDGGDPTEIHFAGGGNARNTFVAAIDYSYNNIAGKLVVSAARQRSGLLSGTQVRLV